MTEAIVLGRGVTRIYPNAEPEAPAAVREATFEVHSGDRIALVGPSGSGKSTLLQLMAGLDAPDEGDLRWPALGERAMLRPSLVAIAFQGPSLLPPLDVTDNVALPLLLQGVSETDARRRASEILERFSLSAVASHFPEELSGGQAQRAGIARALIARPLLVLADEPTGQQDREGGTKILSTMLAWMDELDGSALVVATHDANVASRLVSVWTMDAGHLQVGAMRS